MSLVKKLTIATAVIALALTLNSCVTSGWKYAYPTSSYSRSGKEEKNKTTYELVERTFKIGDPTIVESPEGDERHIPVFESRTAQKFSSGEIKTLQYYNNEEVWKRETKGYGLNVFLALAGLLAGIGVGKNNPGLALLLLAAGVTGGFLTPPIPVSSETEIKQMEESSQTVSSNIETKNLGFYVKYTDKPAANVRYGIKGRDTSLTDAYGNIRFRLSDPDESYTKKGLEKAVYQSPLVQQIQPAIREQFIKEILKDTDVTEEVEIETREIPANRNETVINISQKMALHYYEVKRDVVYSLVKAFVEENINSSIGELKLTNKDQVTRMPINKYNLEFNSQAPEKSKLVEPYFSGELQQYAEELIPDYLTGEGELNDLNSKNTFKVYFPSKIVIQLTHKDYYFLQGMLNLEPTLLKKEAEVIAYMSDKGTKITIGPQSESLGEIVEQK